MNSRMEEFGKRFFNNKITGIVKNIFVVILLFQCIFNLTEYDNAVYGTWKTIAEERALLAFMLVLFIVAQVRLINFQSLVGTLLMAFVAFFRIRPLAESPDLLAIVKCELVSEWAALMIITDLILYKKARNLFKGCNYMLILYFLLTVGMLYRRNGRFEPIIMVFPFALMMFIKINEEEWKWLLKRFIDGWFVTWCYVAAKSIMQNPLGKGRYYGSFLNLGPFGIFMACSLLMGIFALVYSKRERGRLSFFYFASLMWIIGIVLFIARIDTATAYTGMLFALVGYYIFLGKKSNSKLIIRRALIVLGVLVLLLAIFAVLVYALKVPKYRLMKDYAKWDEAGMLSPFVGLYIRLRASANRIEADNFPEMILKALDIFTSGRLSIARVYAPYFNFDGNSNISFMMEDYLVTNPHNNYVQFLTNYGYVSMAELAVLSVLSIVGMIKKYLSDKNIFNALPVLWLFLTAGVWLGETNSLEYPVTFFAMIFVVRTVSTWEEKKNG